MATVNVHRLRWRMRGAWLWPSFVAATLLEGLLLHARPIAGDRTGIVPGVLLAGFLNLVAVAVLAPLLARGIRSRRRDLPRVVAENYAGTALVVAVGAGLLAAGIAHRPAVRAAHERFVAQSVAVHGYVMSQPSAAPYRPGLRRANTIALRKYVYRTCVPGPDPKRPLCLIVNTRQDPPGIRVDGDRAPNASF